MIEVEILWQKTNKHTYIFHCTLSIYINSFSC